MKGIPLIAILNQMELADSKPKSASAIYLVFTASDNYKVVFSWNEIFNTDIGSSIYLITEKDGKSLRALDDRITVISLKDIRSGRRYVKGLAKIMVMKVE